MVRLRYREARAVDGDTIRLSLTSGPKWNRRVGIRILGVDTYEMNSPGVKGRKAELAKQFLESQFSRWFKPKIMIEVTKSKRGHRKVKKDAYGRILARVLIFTWKGYKDYSDIIKDKRLEKKGSKWNEQDN